MLELIIYHIYFCQSANINYLDINLISENSRHSSSMAYTSGRSIINIFEDTELDALVSGSDEDALLINHIQSLDTTDSIFSEIDINDLVDYNNYKLDNDLTTSAMEVNSTQFRGINTMEMENENQRNNDYEKGYHDEIPFNEIFSDHVYNECEDSADEKEFRNFIEGIDIFPLYSNSSTCQYIQDTERTCTHDVSKCSTKNMILEPLGYNLTEQNTGDNKQDSNSMDMELFRVSIQQIIKDTLVKSFDVFNELIRNFNPKANIIARMLCVFCNTYSDENFEPQRLINRADYMSFINNICVLLDQKINTIMDDINKTVIYKIDSMFYKQIDEQYTNPLPKYDEIQTKLSSRIISKAVYSKTRYVYSLSNNRNHLKTLILSKIYSIKDDTIQTTLILMYSFILNQAMNYKTLLQRLLRFKYFIDYYYNDDKRVCKYTNEELQYFYVNKLTWYLFCGHPSKLFKQGDTEFMKTTLVPLEHAILLKKDYIEKENYLLYYGLLVPFRVVDHKFSPLDIINYINENNDSLKESLLKLASLPINISKLFLAKIKKRHI